MGLLVKPTILGTPPNIGVPPWCLSRMLGS